MKTFGTGVKVLTFLLSWFRYCSNQHAPHTLEQIKIVTTVARKPNGTDGRGALGKADVSEMLISLSVVSEDTKCIEAT